MRTSLAIGTAAVLMGFGALATMNYANAAATDKPNDPAPPTAGRSIGGASAPYARVAALVSPGIGTSTLSVVRSKGVAAVTRPSTGQYCIQPSDSTVVTTQIVPVVSVDFSNSLGSNGTVLYRSSGSGCPAGNISVVTYVGTALSNNVAFSLLAI